MTKVAHLTSVHPRNDTRIFFKQCVSLAAHGYQVNLVVADGFGDAQVSGVRIYDVGATKGRFNRIRKVPTRILAQAIRLDADLYHLHDPELLPIGLKLKRLGKRVVFDAHEDVPKQMLSKPYLNAPSLWMLSKAIGVYERWVCRQLDGVIAATPYIRNKFQAMEVRSLDVNNFPLVGELDARVPWGNKALEVCYVGAISRERGMEQVVQAMELVRGGVRLNLCGRFSESDVEQACKAMPGWASVNEQGFVDRTRVREVLGRSMAGLVTLHPMLNYLDALPVKMFEYMAAGVPVIASDFPLWREIVVGNGCGLCVDPMDPAAIAWAIDSLVESPKEAYQMGENGRRAVHSRYNWTVEEVKLLGFYKDLLSA